MEFLPDSGHAVPIEQEKQLTDDRAGITCRASRLSGGPAHGPHTTITSAYEGSRLVTHPAMQIPARIGSLSIGSDKGS